MKKVENFDFDIKKVKAPFIRKSCIYEGANGDKISKFDIRFLQPNKEEFSIEAMNALEHHFNYCIREELDGVIEISPMECRTGFYLSTWGDKDSIEIKAAVEAVLRNLLISDSIPEGNTVECNNYEENSLLGMRECAENAISKGFSLNIYGE